MVQWLRLCTSTAGGAGWIPDWGTWILYTTGLPRWHGGKKLPAHAGDTRNMDGIPGLGSSPGGENGNSLQYSCLENPMERGVRWITAHGVPKSQT